MERYARLLEEQLELENNHKSKIILRDSLREELEESQERQKELKSEIKTSDKFQVILHEVKKQCMLIMREKFESIQNSALTDIITDKKYTFHLDVVSRRGKAEVDIVVRKEYGDEIKYDTLEDGGNGVLSVSRISSVVGSLLLSGRRRFLFLDEEFTTVSKEHGSTNYMVSTFQWLKRMADRFDIQIILITHEEFIRDFVDQSIAVVPMDDGTAKVNTLVSKYTEVTDA